VVSNEISDKKVVSDVLGHLHAIIDIEQVEEILRMTFHVTKTLVKFTLIDLYYDRHV